MSASDVYDRMLGATRGDPAAAGELLFRCLREMRLDLPPVGRDAMAVATRFWTDRSATAADLERARVMC